MVIVMKILAAAFLVAMLAFADKVYEATWSDAVERNANGDWSGRKHFAPEPIGRGFETLGMDEGTINAMVDLIGQQMVNTVDALTPVGQAMATALVVLGVVFLGVSVLSGGSFIGPIFRMTGLAAATYYLLNVWAAMVFGIRDAARGAIGLMLPGGYDGPSSLFHLGNSIVARLELQGVSWSLNPLSMAADAIFIAISEILIWLGFAIVSIIATISEIQLLLAASLAPLVLPFLAFNVTAQIGAAPLRFLLSSAVKMVALGVVCATIVGAVTQLTNVAGTDMVFTTTEVMTLLALSLVSAVIAIGAGSLANGLTGGGFSGMGFSSVQHAGSVVIGGARTAASGAQGVGAAAGKLSVAAGNATGGLGSIAKSVTRSSSTGNPWGK